MPKNPKFEIKHLENLSKEIFPQNVQVRKLSYTVGSKID
jgi:hypothetical protein